MRRVGIVLDSCKIPAWVAGAIEGIQTSTSARIVLVIVGQPYRKKAHWFAKLRDGLRCSVFHLYEQWDYRRNPLEHDALALRDVSLMVSGIASILVQHAGETSSSALADLVAQVHRHNLDAVILFGSHEFERSLAASAKQGAWSFHFGVDSAGGEPPLFWEIFDRSPVSRSALESSSGTPGKSVILCESFAATDQASLYRNRNSVYWKTATFASRALCHLQTFGEVSLLSHRVNDGIADGGGMSRALNSVTMVRFLIGQGVRWLQARVASLQADPGSKWCIVIRRRDATRNFVDPSGYALMPSFRDRFYADPFLFRSESRTFLLFEDFRYSEGRALISGCEVGPDGTPGEPFEVLRRPYHLSYPFLLEDRGEIYMIPETRSNRTIELYRAAKFPHTWVSDAVLLSDIYAVDATIQKIDGRWWMFTSVSDGRYSNSDELSIFFADELRGPWTPHRNNPVLSDVRRARPAGALFYDQGRLIRPSQDCSKAYGYALVFSEVLMLTETDYEEHVIERLTPEGVPGNCANHTYNRTEDFEVMDRNLLVKIANRPAKNGL